MSGEFTLEYALDLLHGRSAGTHNGLRPSVLAANLADGITAAHEAVHECILSSTPDGMAQRLLMAALSFGERLDPPQKEALRRSLDGIADQSRFAHEVAATYLSIKQQPDAVQWLLAAELVRRYWLYYEYLFDLIDIRCQSPTLQLVIGNNIVQAAFSSRFITRLADLDIETPFELARDEQPDSRLRQIVGALERPGVFDDLLAALVARHAGTCRKAGSDNWDITSETQWAQNIGDMGDFSRVTGPLAEEAEAWIFASCGLPRVAPQEARTAVHRVMEQLSRYGVPEERVAYFNNQREWGTALVDRLVSQVELAITNSSPSQVPRADDRALYDPRLFELVERFSLFASPDQPSPPEWHFVAETRAEGGGTDLFEARFGHEAVVHWLSACSSASPTGHVPAAALVVIAESQAWRSAILPVIGHLDRVPSDGRGVAREESLCWYVDSNFVEFVGRAIAAARERQAGAPVALCVVGFNKGGRAQGHDSDRPDATMAVARLPQAAGLFVRVFPEYLGSLLRMHIDQLIARGEAAVLSEADLGPYLGKLHTIMNTAARTWPRY